MSKFTYTIRKDGRLMKKVTIDGKSHYLYSNDPKDLEKQYIDLMYKKNNLLTIENNSITFKKYADAWFERVCSTKETSTQGTIKNRLDHLYQYIGYIKLKDLKQYHVQQVITNMVKNGYTDLVRRTLAECKRILNDAVVNEFISKNVAIGIVVPKFPKNERKPLTLDEDKKVVNFAFTHKYGLFILTLRFCGLRPEEIVALSVNDIDLKNHTVIINKAASLYKNQPKLKATKNLKTRKVPIPSILFEKLKERVDYCNENKIKYIFTKETDKFSMMTKETVKRHLESFLNDLNKTTDSDIHFTCYQLRHSYCTMLYYAGIKIKKAQELMGHSSADMVYNIYTHLDEERENANELLNDYITNTIL